MRQSIDGLGTELQHKGISRQLKWGAKGILCAIFCLVLKTSCDPPQIRDYMTREMGDGPIYPLKRSLFTSEASVQTTLDMSINTDYQGRPANTQLTDDASLSSLSRPELVSIMEWSSEISKNINLFLGKYNLHSIGRI